MKLCKDCLHCGKFDPKRPDLARCLHPVTESKRTSIVTGTELVTYQDGPEIPAQDFLPFCESVRGRRGYCGPDANLFEPIEFTDAIMGDGESAQLRAEEAADMREWRESRSEP